MEVQSLVVAGVLQQSADDPLAVMADLAIDPKLGDVVDDRSRLPPAIPPAAGCRKRASSSVDSGEMASPILASLPAEARNCERLVLFRRVVQQLRPRFRRGL
eukprot:1857783-Pyramimonas_sp.AAC.1